jgi:hypothetical protein
VVKRRPRPEWVERVARRAAIIYAPVDAYDSTGTIDSDAAWLRKCARIVVHCDRLRKYFAPCSSVEYLDHHIKFAAPVRSAFQPGGRLLWVGVRSNLGPLVRWVNTHDLPAPLDVLTNLENPVRIPTADEAGFRTGAQARIHHWTPERQIAMTTSALAALDIKGCQTPTVWRGEFQLPPITRSVGVWSWNPRLVQGAPGFRGRTCAVVHFLSPQRF